MMSESLEERIRKIKLLDEEIEKKHKAAELDKQLAKKSNALVTIKPANEDDWPKEHKYDNCELDFDVPKPEESEESPKQDKPLLLRSKKELTSPPPPDPSYNFLADSERDGNKSKDKKPPQNYENPRNKPKQRQNYDRKQNNFQRTKSQNDTNNWRENNDRNDRNERNEVNNHPPQGQPLGFNPSQPPPQIGMLDRQKSLNNPPLRVKTEQKYPKPEHREPRETREPREARESREPREQRDRTERKQVNVGKLDGSNITVSISKNQMDGEVKSVKLTSPPVIGTGRVGPRQNKPPFMLDDAQSQQMIQNPQSGNLQHMMGHPFAQRNNQPRQERENQHERAEPKEFDNFQESDFSNDSIIKRSSVQDRLKRLV